MCNNTAHTNTLYIYITSCYNYRLVHRGSNDSRHSLTPVRALQRMSKASAHLATPVRASHSDIGIIISNVGVLRLRIR